MVTKRYIKKGEKTFGPYYYESYRDASGKVKKRYIHSYKENVNKKNIQATLAAIGIIIAVLLLFILLNQQFSQHQITGNAVFTGKKAYVPGDNIAGEILFNLRAGESIPEKTLVSISLGETKEEFILSDFVDYKPAQGKIYAQSSDIAGEGMVFGIPGKIYKDVSFELEIEEETHTPSQETPQETQELPSEEETQTTSDTPTEESQETPSEESESGITGQVISQETIAGTASHNNPFTYHLKPGQRARLVRGSVNTEGQEIDESEVSLDIENDVVTVSTDYALEGFGPEFLGEENAMTFKIDISDLELKATSGQLEIEISYDGQEIAYYKETILVGEETPALAPTEPPTLIKEVPSIRIPFGQNAIIDLSEYFAGAQTYQIAIQDIAVDLKGNLLELTPNDNFKGARKVKITAIAGEQSVESNEFLVLVSAGAVQMKTTREAVRLGEPVKWTKTITKELADEELKVEIPIEAQNIEIKTKEDQTIQVIENPSLSPLTGNVVIQVKLENKKTQHQLLSKGFKTWFASLKAEFSKKLKVTGQAVEITPSPAADNTLDITLDEPQTTQYEIEYVTPAPEAIEQQTENGKLVTITAPSELGYTDIIAFTEVDNTVPIQQQNKIKVYWYNYEHQSLSQEEIQEATTTKVADVPEEQIVEDITVNQENPELSGNIISTTETKSENYMKEEVVFDAYDLDADGNVDYIEWVVPHLSNQTYEIIIEIASAQHLDQNKTFITNIFNEVYQLDGIWSETIPTNHYVRISFEQNLTSINDMTLYPKTISGTPRIEVYEKDQSEIIAQFDNITDNEYNKVYLTNLENPQDTFDLLVLDGDVQFDHIIDPYVDNGSLIQSLNDCGTLNTTNGVYTLSGDITNVPNLTGSCINIRANNITLNGNSHILDCGSREVYGVNVTGFSNFTISNMVIASCNNVGIYVQSATGGRIQLVYIVGDEAVTISNSRSIVVNQNRIETGTGIAAMGSDYLNITNNTITTSIGEGIIIQISTGAYVYNNSISGPVENIFMEEDVYNTTILQNTISGGSEAIALYGYAQYNTIRNNIINNVTRGIYISGSEDTLLDSGTINGSRQYGLYFANNYGSNTITNITITNTNSSSYDLYVGANSNETTFINTQKIMNYTLSGIGSAIIVRDSTYGEIKFLQMVNGSGNNFTRDMNLAFEVATVRADLNPGLNRTANVTLYEVTPDFSNPRIIKDGTMNCPSNICYNFTTLNTEEIKFNVTSWGVNYSLAEGIFSDPIVDPILPTPNDGEFVDKNFTVAVNVTLGELPQDSIRFRLYNSSLDLINQTYSTSSIRNLTYTNLQGGIYYFDVFINDSAGNSDLTETRSIKILPRCLELAACTEDSSCVIEQNCLLNSQHCSGSICDFTVLTSNSTIYTLYDTNGDGNDLALNLTSNVQRAPLKFFNGSRITFSGKNGSDITGTQGGDAGTLNITVPDLFNATWARFTGQGGYSTASSTPGGDGGILQLNFHGLIRNLTASSQAPRTAAPSLIGGNSVSSIVGTVGRSVYVKNLETCPRDADPSTNGLINTGDIIALKDIYYNNQTGSPNFNQNYDINCDEIINVIDLSKVGFEFGTR